MSFTSAPAPFFQSIQDYLKQDYLGFHVPGHQPGPGAPQGLGWLLPGPALAADLTQVEGVDDLHRPQHACRQAQELAALAWGADFSYFLVNGSTAGNQAMLMASLNPGEAFLAPRNAHRSLWGAAILADCRPIFYDVPYDPELGLTHPPETSVVLQALQQHPEARALFLSSPTYYGTCPDLQSLIAAAHQRGLPVLVDEAWGAHLPFHPELPPSALEMGADLVVQSTHKLLSALSQASMLHLQGARVCRQRLESVLQILQTSSPSCLLLASLDLARQHMVEVGEESWGRVLALSAEARQRLQALPGLLCPGQQLQGRPGVHRVDLSRLILGVAPSGWTGYATEDWLRQHHRLQFELSSTGHVLALVTLGHRSEHLERLCLGLKAWSEQAKASPLRLNRPPAARPDTFMSPRQAFLAPAESVPLAGARDRISAEIICPYPPGIPLVYPGEILDADMLDHLQGELAAGVRLQGTQDPRLETIRVIRN